MVAFVLSSEFLWIGSEEACLGVGKEAKKKRARIVFYTRGGGGSLGGRAI